MNYPRTDPTQVIIIIILCHVFSLQYFLVRFSLYCLIFIFTALQYSMVRPYHCSFILLLMNLGSFPVWGYFKTINNLFF